MVPRSRHCRARLHSERWEGSCLLPHSRLLISRLSSSPSSFQALMGFVHVATAWHSPALQPLNGHYGPGSSLPVRADYLLLLLPFKYYFFLKIQQLHSRCSRNCRQVQITSCTKAPEGSWSSQARGSSGDTCVCCAQSPLPAPPSMDVLTRAHSVGAARGGAPRGGAHSENPAGTRSCPRLCCSSAGWYPGGSCAVGGSHSRRPVVLCLVLLC